MKPLPMLATKAAPFDAEDYLFEVKWDGVRALAAVEQHSWSLWGRHGVDYTPRYPELAVLRRLTSGTVVDGELVTLDQGRADLPALLRRHLRQRTFPASYVTAPLCYVLFDLLSLRGQWLLKEPLVHRRALLRELLDQIEDPLLAYSDGIVGAGRAFFDKVVAEGHEGVVAKHCASRYLPGQRSSSWRKIKPALIEPCVIIGYQAGRSGVQRLWVAAAREDGLRYVGQLTRGFTASQAVELEKRLAPLRRSRPVTPCPLRACWVEPELYCRVQSQGWTNHGRLRHAVFRSLLE
jgi:bifunctional non-homologous end joining protein LigD